MIASKLLKIKFIDFLLEPSRAPLHLEFFQMWGMFVEVIDF